MSSDLQLADEELFAAMATLKQQTDKVVAAGLLTEKKQLEHVARAHWRKVRTLSNAFKSQIRKCDDATQKTVFQKKSDSYVAELKETDTTLKAQIHPPKKSELNKKKSVTEREQEELMGEGGADGSGFQNATQVLKAGERIQTDTLKSIARSERLQNSSEETGQAALSMLQKQTEKMYQVDDELQNLQGNLDRASRDVQWFARQMASDKCFMMIFCFVLAALLVVIFWKIYSRRKEEADDPETRPPAEADVPQPINSGDIAHQLGQISSMTQYMLKKRFSHQ